MFKEIEEGMKYKKKAHGNSRVEKYKYQNEMNHYEGSTVGLNWEKKAETYLKDDR